MDPTMDQGDHQVHKWLQSSQRSTSRPESQNYPLNRHAQHQESNSRPMEQEYGNYPLHAQGSEEFIPGLDMEDSGAPPSSQPVAVAIRPPQHGNSQYGRQHQQQDPMCINDFSIDSVQSANQIAGMVLTEIQEDFFF